MSRKRHPAMNLTVAPGATSSVGQRMRAVERGAVLILHAYRPLLQRAVRRVLVGRRHDPTSNVPARWTKREADDFLSATWVRLPELVAQARLSELPNWGNRHNVLLAAITVAAYQELRDRDRNPTESAEWVGDIGWAVYARLLGIAAAPAHLLGRDPGRRIARALHGLMIFPFSAPGRPGYEVKLWSDDVGLHTHFTWCPPQAFVREVIAAGRDEGELEAFRRSWCSYDWPGADLLAGDGRRGHYERTQTLAAGDPVCNMCWRGNVAEVPGDLRVQS